MEKVEFDALSVEMQRDILLENIQAYTWEVLKYAEECFRLATRVDSLVVECDAAADWIADLTSRDE